MAVSAHSLSILPLPTITKPKSSISNPYFSLSSFSSQKSFLGTLTFSLIHSSRASPILTSTKRASITSFISLPNKKPEGATGEEYPKWTWRAIKSFAMGELEARKLKYPTTGTEAILMGILIEGTSLASKLLREYGITLTKVREESIKLLGKGDLYFFSPEHPPLTESAEKALDWAVNQKLKSGENGEITTTDLLLGIWSEVESPGHKILAALGFDDEKANNLKSLSSKPGFDEG